MEDDARLCPFIVLYFNLARNMRDTKSTEKVKSYTRTDLIRVSSSIHDDHLLIYGCCGSRDYWRRCSCFLVTLIQAIGMRLHEKVHHTYDGSHNSLSSAQ